MNILNITSYGDLFPPDLDKAKTTYRNLCKRWHPDSPNGDKNVFEHISMLFQQAEKDISEGRYQASDYVEIKTADKTLKIKYLYKQVFELGTCYVCRENIIYVLNTGTDKFMENAVKQINSLHYPNDKIKETMEHCFPVIHGQYKSNKGEPILVLKKDADTFPLSLLVKAMDNMPPEHAAWVITRLHNIECSLSYMEIVHNGIIVDNIFVNPYLHGICLFGGWWYAGNVGQKMIGTNTQVHNIMPIHVKNSRLYDTSTDLEAIKQVGRTICCSSNPRIIMANANIPMPMRNFLIEGSSDDAIREYQKWEKSLDAAYGKRVFRTINITSKQIYQKETR